MGPCRSTHTHTHTHTHTQHPVMPWQKHHHNNTFKHVLGFRVYGLEERETSRASSATAREMPSVTPSGAPLTWALAADTARVAVRMAGPHRRPCAPSEKRRGHRKWVRLLPCQNESVVCSTQHMPRRRCTAVPRRAQDDSTCKASCLPHSDSPQRSSWTSRDQT
jgi:hypothetical protein